MCSLSDGMSVSGDGDKYQIDTASIARDRKFMQMEKGFLICVAYGCNTGGAGSLTGTPPNLVVKKFADEYVEFTLYGNIVFI